MSRLRGEHEEMGLRERRTGQNVEGKHGGGTVETVVVIILYSDIFCAVHFTICFMFNCT